MPPNLSTPDDMSVAFHMAVSSPEIDWSFAEGILEIFSFLWTELLAAVDNDIECINFGEAVWYNNNFDSNLAKLSRGGDCRRVRKSLVFITHMINGESDCILIVSAEMFDSLASIILQPMLSSQEDNERKLVYLIAKNQDMAIDGSISRLIDSFIYSRKEKVSIAYNVLKILSAFECIHISNGTKIPKALIKILIKK
jgi:hypothetical protein